MPEPARRQTRPTRALDISLPRECVVNWCILLGVFVAFVVAGACVTGVVGDICAVSLRTPFLPTLRPFRVVSIYEPSGHAHLAADALDPAGLLPFTAEFQRQLFVSQHPADCSKARFLVVDPGTNGLGSIVHVSGHHLLIAHTRGFVFLWGNATGADFVLGDPARLCPRGALNVECFFRPPSHCTLKDAIDWEALARAPPENAAKRRAVPLREGSFYVHHEAPGTLHVSHDDTPHTLPRSLYIRLGQLGMSDWQVKSWSRAQSVAYLMRLNDVTVAALKAMRLDDSLHGDAGAGAPPRAGLPFPLPPGTVSAHVRHGDKWKEMRLVPEGAYLEAARATLRASSAGSSPAVVRAAAARALNFSAAVSFAARKAPQPPLAALAPLLFVSTEDADALMNLIAAAEPVGWRVAFSRLPRINDGPVAQMKSAPIPAVALTRLHLGQLLLALECDAWVGTYASNWNRLIDELRGVWVPKVNGLCSEIGELVERVLW